MCFCVEEERHDKNNKEDNGQRKIQDTMQGKKKDPIKKIKKTPTRERSNISTTQGKKMNTTILQGIKLGWGYFRHAQPDTYEDLDMWIM